MKVPETPFVTGGIGRALAAASHERGHQMIVAGRRQAMLDERTRNHPGMAGLPLDIDALE